MQHSILLADANILRRQGLRALLAVQGEFEVAEEAGDAGQALNKAIACQPALLLIDAALPDLGGFRAAAQIKRHAPGTRAIMLTQSKTNDCAHVAQPGSADAYVPHDASFEELLLTLRRVARGENPLDPGVWQPFGGEPNPRAPAGAAPQGGAVKLTTRERSVLQLVAEGRTNRAAAEFLGVSPKTVEQHRAGLMRKFGLRSAAEMILAAIDMGLIERPAPGSRRAPTAACAMRRPSP